ncbi:MAG: phage portal protein [Janthinobacterium lividum]
MLRRPAPAWSWSRWAGAQAASLLTTGNALCAVTQDGRGGVTGLLPVPWGWTNPQVLPSGRLVYDVVQNTPEARALGIPSGRLLDTDVLHVRARADGGGLIGRSVLSRARTVIAEGHELSRVANAAWRQSARPSGWLATTRVLNDDQRRRAEGIMDSFAGSLNTGRVPLLEDDWQFKQQTFNFVDAEFLASRAFSVAEVARIFCIPEPMLQVGAHAPADLTPYLSAFATLALSPIVTAIEDEFTHSVLPDGYRLQIDMGGLMRGSWSSLVAGAAAARMAGLISANDGRALMSLPPRADGDALASSPGPAHFPADGPGMPHLGPSPGPTGTGLPEPGTNANKGAT